MRLSHRLYYFAKPVLPWRMRMAIRRAAASRKLKSCADIWPIDPRSAKPPAGWTGWPDGKRFALVLTHDVEGPSGLANCRRLADAEGTLGFRSSFNFIPEGSYRVTAELRHWLDEHDFEVGVHDLHHNGFLYLSSPTFRRKADRINHYLREWGAKGFRSGFMFRNLAWLHQLDIAYDASTFDTDPFEPQFDGSGTIFPFWIGRPEVEVEPVPPSGPTPVGRPHRRAGYWELPYTLPQDSTLFLLLQETSNEIWMRKLDWIAKSGGMALINVHPDYMDVKTGTNGASRSAGDHYFDLLRYITSRYPGEYWHCLPREMAAFFANRET